MEHYRGLSVEQLRECCDELVIDYADSDSERMLRRSLAKYYKEKEERELQLVREREVRDREMQLELARINARNENVNGNVNGMANGNQGRENGGFKNVIAKLITPFDESKMHVAEFLKAFEKTASLHEIPKEKWALGLSSVLTGKGLMIFSSLSADDCGNYETVKAAILEKYQISSEYYRKQFRETNKTENEILENSDRDC